MIDAGTLERLVSSTAGGLRRQGVRRGDIVAWQLPNWWEALVLFRACWRCGAVAAPIHHQVGPAEVARVLDDLSPALTLSTAGQPLAGLVDAVGVRGGDARFDDLLAGPPVAAGAARGSDMAVILFTSGSTGHPKAVLHTHRGLAYKARSMTQAHGLTTTDVALMPSPTGPCVRTAQLDPGAGYGGDDGGPDGEVGRRAGCPAGRRAPGHRS